MGLEIVLFIYLKYTNTENQLICTLFLNNLVFMEYHKHSSFSCPLSALMLTIVRAL